ncbi:histidine kinase A domain protein [Bacteriovorax sp. BSW11_IV]|nr:histidine kinase A domain protein [Bacteriovorax sp. BSW11_IV]
MFKSSTISGRLFLLSALPALGGILIVMMVLILSEGWSLREGAVVAQSRSLEEAFQRTRIAFSRLANGLNSDMGLFLGQKSLNYENYSKSRTDFSLQLNSFNKERNKEYFERINDHNKKYEQHIDDFILIQMSLGRMDRGLSGRVNNLINGMEENQNIVQYRFDLVMLRDHFDMLIQGDRKGSLLINNYLKKIEGTKSIYLDEVISKIETLQNEILSQVDKLELIKKEISQNEINLQITIEQLYDFIEGNYTKNIFFMKLLIGSSLLLAFFVSVVFGQFIARSILKPIDIVVDHLESPERVSIKDHDFSAYEEIEKLALGINRYEEKIAYQQRKIEMESRFLTLGQISSGLSHELKNPLAIIRGRAQYLEKYKLQLDSKAVGESITSIYEQVDRINSTLMGIKNIILGHKIEQYQDFNFNSIFTHIRLLLTKKLEEDGIELNVSTDSHQIDFYGHEILLSEAIYSLINQSRKETRGLEHSKIIDVKIKTNYKKIYVVIDDSANNANRNPVSTFQKGGLPLEVCKKVIREHGGLLWMKQDKKYGRFTLQFPKKIPAAL